MRLQPTELVVWDEVVVGLELLAPELGAPGSQSRLCPRGAFAADDLDRFGAAMLGCYSLGGHRSRRETGRRVAAEPEGLEHTSLMFGGQSLTAVVLPYNYKVEVAGFEPASSGAAVGLLRAQPAEDCRGRHNCRRQCRPVTNDGVLNAQLV